MLQANFFEWQNNFLSAYNGVHERAQRMRTTRSVTQDGALVPVACRLLELFEFL